MRRELRPAVFLDKDGTLIEDVPYNVDPGQVRLAVGACEAVRLLTGGGYALVVVSNQSGIARGLFEEAALAAIESRLRELVGQCGTELAGFYYCPHHPAGSIARYAVHCDCRKPSPGMIVRAARELELDLSRSWLIGDILDDIAAGNAAGCRTVLIDNGNETQWRWSDERRPDVLAGDLAEAARSILANACVEAAP